MQNSWCRLGQDEERLTAYADRCESLCQRSRLCWWLVCLLNIHGTRDTTFIPTHLSKARNAAGSTSGSSISADVVAIPPLNMASKTALPAASTNLCAGIRWASRPLPTTNLTSLSSSLLKRNAKRSFTELLVACQLYMGSRCRPITEGQSGAAVTAAAAPLPAAERERLDASPPALLAVPPPVAITSTLDAVQLPWRIVTAGAHTKERPQPSIILGADV